MKTLRKMRLLVVDADALTRAGILAHLRSQKGRYEGVAAGNAAEARAACAKQAPDLILLDLPLPGGDGLGLLRELARLAPQARRAVMGTNGDRPGVERVLAAGGQAFIHREDAPGALDEAFATILRGERYLSPRAGQMLLSTMAQRPARPRACSPGGDADTARLSDRELAIYTAMGAGHGPTRIALDLRISVKTVETHHRRIREKLEVGSTEALRERARRWLAADRAR